MKVVVTGGAGFIGANLCRELVLARGYDVVVLDDLSTGRRSNLNGLDVDLRVGSILDPALVASAFRGADAVVHLAAVPSVPRSIVDPLRSHEVNTTGTLAVLEGARAEDAHVVLASSSSVYGRNPVLPKTEGMLLAPASPYAASKAAGEAYAQAYRSAFGVECLIFRFFNVFGPLQSADHAYAAVLPVFIDAALRGRPLTVHGDGEQSRDFTFVQTVVEVLAASVEARRSHVTPVNLAFGTRTTLNEVIALLARIVDRPVKAIHSPERAGDVRHSQADNSVLRELFPTIRPVAFEPALTAAVEWMRSELRVPAARAGSGR